MERSIHNPGIPVFLKLLATQNSSAVETLNMAMNAYCYYMQCLWNPFANMSSNLLI